MSSSSTISSLQQALNCAGKCDCCNKLQSQINDLKAEISRIPRVDENRIIKSTKSALEPGIATAVAGGIAVAIDRFKPSVDAALKKSSDAFLEAVEATKNARLAEIEAKGASSTATRAEKNAAEYARQMREEQAKVTRIEGETARLNRENQALKLTDDELRNLARTNEVEARRAANIAKKLEGEIPPIRNSANTAQSVAERASSTVNKVESTIEGLKGSIGNAVSTSAKASKEALNAASEVTGINAIVKGLGSKVDDFGRAIAKVESAVGIAVTNAAKAVGISETALAATGRLLGRIADIFNIIGTFAVLFEQIATLRVLGGRIDAVEAGSIRLANDVSGVLGRIFQLNNRLAGNESTINNVRGIAQSASSLASSANLRADGAYSAAGQAQLTANSANGKAGQAQFTADGAVRNASTANDNAKIAYQKALETTTIANNATTTANNATTKANQATITANNATTKAKEATSKAGEAFQKALEGLGLALTAIAFYQTFKGLKGLQGIPGIPGRQGIPGKDGITTVVQVPGIPGKQGDRGFPGISGLPGRNGKDGRDGIDVSPAETASLRALIISQHNQTRGNSTSQHGTTRAAILAPIMAALAPILALLKQIYDAVMAISNAAILALLNVINTKLGAQVTGGLSQFIKTIAENTYLEKALSVLTFAATIHNALMLSNNLGQTLIMVVDQVTGFLLPKGVDGTPISFGDTLGKAVHLVIESAIGEENYTQLSEGWQKANRIYQATSNVYNQVTNLGGILTAGMEVIGGNVGKIGNALKKGGVLLEDAYAWMNPQPNLKGKFFPIINSANENLLAIAAVVAIPIALKEVAGGINSSVSEMKREISQTDPKDAQGNPIRDDKGEIVRYKPGLEVPTPIVVEQTELQSKADSGNFLALVLDDIFDGGD